MLIQLNGQSADVGEHASVSELVAGLALEGQRLAVEVDGEIVPRGRWAQVRLAPGNRVEVVKAIGGG